VQAGHSCSASVQPSSSSAPPSAGRTVRWRIEILFDGAGTSFAIRNLQFRARRTEDY
jgi:hypothetical protein